MEKDMTWWFVGAGMTFVWCYLTALARDRHISFGNLLFAAAFWPLFIIIAFEQVLMWKIERKRQRKLEIKAELERQEVLRARRRELQKLIEGGPIRVLDL